MSSLSIPKKNDFAEWYKHILVEGNFIRYYDVSGCYVMLPYSYSIWENIKQYLNIEFKKKMLKTHTFLYF